jgi:hypothetical protein
VSIPPRLNILQTSLVLGEGYHSFEQWIAIIHEGENASTLVLHAGGTGMLQGKIDLLNVTRRKS